MKTLLLLAMLGVLSACASDNTSSAVNASAYNAQADKTADHTQQPPTQAHAMTPKVTLNAIDLSDIGKATMIFAHQQLFVVNDKGELWQLGHQKLADHVSLTVSPVANFNKIAFADHKGNLAVLDNGTLYQSAIKLSKNSGILLLPQGVIAVINDNHNSYLARIELINNQLTITAKYDKEVLPDAQPMLIDFDGQDLGHVAVLASPDSHTYQHGVLGDGIESKEVVFLERHNLTPLATSLKLDRLVFENNRFERLTQNNRHYLVTTVSGDGSGARVVLIDNINGNLTLVSQSTALPNNRWQSPFVFDQKLYAVLMPHLKGTLVAYHNHQGRLTQTELDSGLSNHPIGSHHTNMVAQSRQFAVIPRMGYQSVVMLDKNSTLSQPQSLPAPLMTMVGTDNAVYLLLDNGTVWQANAW